MLEGSETPLKTEWCSGNADARARRDGERPVPAGARRAHESGLAVDSPGEQPAGRVGARDSLTGSVDTFLLPPGLQLPFLHVGSEWCPLLPNLIPAASKEPARPPQ